MLSKVSVDLPGQLFCPIPDCDGTIGISDFNAFRAQFRQAQGS